MAKKKTTKKKETAVDPQIAIQKAMDASRAQIIKDSDKEYQKTLKK